MKLIKQSGWAVVVAIFVGALGTASPALGDDGSYVARLSQQYGLRLEPSPRILGLAGAYAAASKDIDGLVGNPAAIGFTKRNMASLDGGWFQLDSEGPDIYAIDDVDTDLFHVRGGVIFPIQDILTIGLQYGYRNSDEDFDPGDDFDFDRHVIALTLAKDILPEVLSIGYRFHYFNDERDGTRVGGDVGLPNPPWALVVPYEWNQEYENDGFLHTFGVQWIALENLTAGLVFEYGHGEPELNETLRLGQYFFLSEDTPPPVEVQEALIDAFEGNVLPVLRSDYTLDSDEGDMDQFQIRGGVAWTPLEKWPMITLDLAYGEHSIKWDAMDIDRDEFSLHLGLEHQCMEMFTARLGYGYANVDMHVDVERPGISGEYNQDLDIHTITAGFRVDFGPAWLDYGFGIGFDGDDENMTHLAGVTVPF